MTAVALLALVGAPLGLLPASSLRRVPPPPPMGLRTAPIVRGRAGAMQMSATNMTATGPGGQQPAEQQAEQTRLDTEPDSSAGDAFRQGAGFVGDALLFAWTIIVNVLGGALTLGLLLNLSGYGYRYSLRPPSLEVKPLAQMRQENADKRFFARDFNGLFPEL